MPKKNPANALVPVAAAPVSRVMAGHEVVVEAVYHVASVHPSRPGPWSEEADKIAWIDPLHGYGCIIRRSERQGYLGGFVGVGRDHPLFGWDEYALRAAGLRAHGGISYAAECRDWEGPERDICHVHPVRERSRDTAASRARKRSQDSTATSAHEVVLDERSHEDLWWIGFECNKPEDLVPDEASGPRRSSGYEGAIDPVYRDEGYVFEQCASLAAQLAAIEHGRDPSEAVSAFDLPVRSVPPLAVSR